MPEKKRTKDKQKHYIGFEISQSLYEKIQAEANKHALRVSTYARMLIADKFNTS